MGLEVSSVGGGNITLSDGSVYNPNSTPQPTGVSAPTGSTTGLNGAAIQAPQQPMGPAAPVSSNTTGNDYYRNGKWVDATTAAQIDNAQGFKVESNGAVSYKGQPLTDDQQKLWDAAHQPKPGAPAAPPVDYYSQYNAMLEASRANLTNQYHQAQSSINTQEGLANQQVMTMPGQFKTIAGNLATDSAQGNASILAADRAAGVAATGNGAKGTGLALAGAQQTMATAAKQNAAGQQALVPSLALGVTTQMAAERAALNDNYTSAQGALDTAAMGVEASRAAAQASQANATAAQQTAHDQAVSDATTAFNRQVILSQITSGQGLNAASTKVPGMTVGDEKAVGASPYFSLISNEINTGKMTDGSPVTLKTLSEQVNNLTQQGGGATGIKITGFSGGNAGAGLLQVLKSYYGPNFGLLK